MKLFQIGAGAGGLVLFGLAAPQAIGAELRAFDPALCSCTGILCSCPDILPGVLLSTDQVEALKSAPKASEKQIADYAGAKPPAAPLAPRATISKPRAFDTGLCHVIGKFRSCPNLVPPEVVISAEQFEALRKAQNPTRTQIEDYKAAAPLAAPAAPR